jgi:hypothetical protein
MRRTYISIISDLARWACVADHWVCTWRDLVAPEIFCRTLPTFSASTWAR